MLLQHKKIIIFILCICILWVVVATTCIVLVTAKVAPKSPGPGITLSSSPIDQYAGKYDNKASYTIRVKSETTVTETVTLSVNQSFDYSILRDYSFSDNNFNLAPGDTKDVTLSMTIYYGTTPRNYTIKVDGSATYLPWLPPETTSTACYVEVRSTVVPLPPPVPVPEYNAIGLLALIGILSVVLATVMMRRK
jgi:hypothetical protein